jgi:glycine dehydrogenase subunit 1
VLVFNRPVAQVLDALAKHGIAGGFDLTPYYPELGNALLVCATESRTTADIEKYVKAIA